MYVVMGATGHIGSALARRLLEHGNQVHVVLHREKEVADWRARGATSSVADVRDPVALRSALAGGKRAFLLNPPAPPGSDAEAQERATVRSIITALRGLPLEQVVAESTYGAREGSGIGDLGALYELERALAEQPVPARVIRAAYYLSNWDSALDSARNEGVLHTFYPPDFHLPMVAPGDIAQVAFDLLTASPASNQLCHVEGPDRYTPADVARAFSLALGKPVHAVETPRAAWGQALSALGFSEAAASSFIGMTEATLKAEFPTVSETRRGPTSLDAYVAELVSRNCSN